MYSSGSLDKLFVDNKTEPTVLEGSGIRFRSNDTSILKLKGSMKLYIFDLDGTLIDDMGFYRKIYTENLEKLVLERHGEAGLQIVNMVRQTNRGKGELALLVLGISYDEWFDRVTDADVQLLAPKPELVEAMKKIKGIKVVFTGTNKTLAEKMLARVGFSRGDFNEIIAHEKPAVVPLKLTADKLVFQYLLDKYKIAPRDAYVVGDEYEFDLRPAKALGINTIEVRHKSGHADHFVANILDLPNYLTSIQ